MKASKAKKSAKQAETQRPVRAPRVPVKVQRTLMLTALLVAIGLVVFVEIIRPNQDAKTYTQRLETSSKPLEACFNELTKTTDLQIYYAPDVAYATKAADTATILKQIEKCRQEMKHFDESAHALLTLRFAGYTPTYRDAKVSQRQAYDVVGQSNDVLDQYQAMAAFLADYYKHVHAFTTYTGNLANVTYVGATERKVLAEQANDLRNRSVMIQQLTAPAEFESTKNATSAMFAKAADGFDRLVEGYTYSNDFSINAGYASIDQAVADFNSNVMNMPFDQLVNSYIPQQVKQLPAKVEGFLATSSE